MTNILSFDVTKYFQTSLYTNISSNDSVDFYSFVSRKNSNMRIGDETC